MTIRSNTRRRLLLIGCLLGLGAFGQDSRAGTVVVDFVRSGSFNSSGRSENLFDNYEVGTGIGEKNWFVFDLSGITGTITSATFRVNAGTMLGDGLYEVFDVETPVADLVQFYGQWNENPSIYDELATGTPYGAIELSWFMPRDSVVDIALSAAAVASLNQAGGLWALSGSFSGHYAMNYTANSGFERQLILEVSGTTAVPEPSALALGGIGGMLGVFAVRRGSRSSRQSA